MCTRTGTAEREREDPNFQRGRRGRAASHPTGAQGNSQGQSQTPEEAREDDGEVHAQVQGRRGGRHGGHAGRRRPHQVQGRRRRQEDQEAAPAVASQGRQRCRCCCVSGRWPEQELLPQAAQPHALHGAVDPDARRRPRSSGARLRPLALLQHGVLGGRLVHSAGQEPALPLRRRRGGQRQRSAGIGERQQLGERPRPPREEGDDAVQPPAPRRAQRPGVGSGGAKRQPLAAVSVDDFPSSGGREGEDARASGDRGVLRGGRGGPGQALRVQVQLRRRPRRAPLRRPVRLDPGGEQLTVESERARAKGWERSCS